METLDLHTIYLHIEREINHLAQSKLFRHNEELKKDAHEIVFLLKEDLEIWIPQFIDKRMSICELERLIMSKKPLITLDNIKEIRKDIPEEEFNLAVFGILRLIVNVIMEHACQASTACDNSKLNKEEIESIFG